MYKLVYYSQNLCIIKKLLEILCINGIMYSIEKFILEDKVMKKFISLLLVLALSVFVFAACSNKTETTTEGNDEPTETKLEKITVATNAEFPPFEYLEGEEMVGADIDMAKAIAEYLGCEVEITNIDFDAALTGAATGKYDLAIAGITATDERKQNMSFSDNYYKASQAIIVNDGSEIKGSADLEGKTIACQEGTTGEQFLLDGGYSIQSFKTGSEAITALTTGKVDAVVIDNAVANALSSEQGGKTVVLEEALTEEAYAIATKLGNDSLLAKVNEAIKELKANGKLAEIFASYDLVVDAE